MRRHAARHFRESAPDEMRGKRSVGSTLRATTKVPHNITSPPGGPASAPTAERAAASARRHRAARETACPRGRRQTRPIAPADMMRKSIRSLQSANSSRSGKKRRMIGYLCRCCDRQEQSPARRRKAAAQISAGRLHALRHQVALQESVERRARNRPRLIGLAPAGRHGIGAAVRCDGGNDFSRDGIDVGREDERAERVLERRRVDLLRGASRWRRAPRHAPRAGSAPRCRPSPPSRVRASCR